MPQNTRTDFNTVRKIFNQARYIQGFSANPAFIMPAAWSGMWMKSQIGYGYSMFLFSFNETVGEMSYLEKDLRRLWSILQIKLRRDPRYLRRIKRKYQHTIKKATALFKEIDEINFRALSEKEFITLLRRAVTAHFEAVGAGHIIEPIGIELEKSFRQRLEKFVAVVPMLNQYFSLLTTPTKASFAALEETDLRKIARLPKTQQAEALRKHSQRYEWISNSYVRRRQIPISEFRKRLQALANIPSSPNTITRRKMALIRRLRLDKKMREMIEWIDFATVWQDERKANILRTVSYLGQIFDELARRSGVEKETVYQLTVQELLRLRSVREVERMKSKLFARRKGCFIVSTIAKEYIVTGAQYQKLRKVYDEIQSRERSSENEIHATTANSGTAVGRAVICHSLKSLAKVRPGDIIVAPMTRPEYMTALKKAAAIVTDEGGITCHAAIISRELDIPCIIGTKIGTKVFNDGQKLEVRADHGLVRALEE
ncbi:MAG: PEP-utilizing enzyme [bacterium]|nr:PEP-utilizing enzyme [bacterium]